MVDKILLVFLGALLLGEVFLLGGLRPLHPNDSYLMIGATVMVVEILLALCFARRFLASVLKADAASWYRRIVAPLAISIAAAMVPTIPILYVDQALDPSPGVEQTLPVKRTYSRSHKGDTTYFAVVPGVPPHPFLGASDADDDIRLPRETWQRLVPGRSMLRLTIHPGLFGLPWYTVVGTSPTSQPIHVTP